MKEIKEFIKKITESLEPFEISDDQWTYSFMQRKVGKAKYIYMINSLYRSITDAPDLFAIVVDGKIYIMDNIIFHLYEIDKKTLADYNIYYYSEENQKYQDYIKNVVFQKFYDKLDISKKTLTPSEINYCKKMARQKVLQNIESEYTSTDYFTFEFENVLCGFVDAEKNAIESFEEKKNDWIHMKAIKTKINEYIEDTTIIKDWEKRILEAIELANNMDYKTVVVEFEVNHRLKSEKIEPYKLRAKLADEGTFTAYNFYNSRRAEVMLTALGVNKVTCEQIKKITYGKKTLYERDKT